MNRFRSPEGVLFYDLEYTNPSTGKPHAHLIPVEAVGTRMELFGITREEALELIISETHSPADDVNSIYRTTIRRKRQATQQAARECRAQRRPWRIRLDIESDTFSKTAVDRAGVDYVRTYRPVLGGTGWDKAAAWMEADREEIDLHAAWYIASHLATIETQEGRE